jgi:hypothetical protein
MNSIIQQVTINIPKHDFACVVLELMATTNIQTDTRCTCKCANKLFSPLDLYPTIDTIMAC